MIGVRRLARIALGAGLMACAMGPRALAATYQVDDAGTLPGAATMKMYWRSFGPSRQAGNLVDGSTVVTVVLNTAPWAGRVGRIYMALPAQAIGAVGVDWTTQGRLLAGTLVSGGRSLVYAGPVRSAMLSDTLTVRVHTDGRRLTTDQQLRFRFEIDVD